jgi:hypothetical protein
MAQLKLSNDAALRDVIIKPEREEFVSPMALRGR